MFGPFEDRRTGTATPALRPLSARPVRPWRARRIAASCSAGADRPPAAGIDVGATFALLHRSTPTRGKCRVPEHRAWPHRPSISEMPVQPSTVATTPFKWRRMRVVWPFVAIIPLLLLLGRAETRGDVGDACLRQRRKARDRRHSQSPSAIWSSTCRRGTRVPTPAFSARWRHFPPCGKRGSNWIRNRPDSSLAKRALGAAGIHSTDAESVIGFYRTFRRVGFMTTTTALWDQADAQVAELGATSQAMHSIIAGGKAPAGQSAADIEPRTRARSASSPRSATRCRRR